VNSTEIKARLYDIEKEMPNLIEDIFAIAKLIREEVNSKELFNKDFGVLNAGLMFEKVHELSKKGLSIKEKLKKLLEEKKKLETMLNEGGE